MVKNQRQTTAVFAVSISAVVVVVLLLAGAGIGLLVRQTNANNDQQQQQQQLSIHNMKWYHSEGHVCLRPPLGVQFIEYERDTVTVQEIIGDKVYMYSMVNTDFLYKEVADLGAGLQGGSISSSEIEAVDITWIDGLVGIKYNCVVEPLEDKEMNDLFDNKAVLVDQNLAGGSTWKVGAWKIQADANLVPLSLSSPPADDDDDEDFTLELTAVGTCEVPIVGCDPEREAGDGVPYAGPTTEQIGAVLHTWGIKHEHGGGSSSSNHNNSTGTRFLSAWQDFQNFATRNWCGSGPTPKSDPCPGDPSIDIALYDYDADRACRRHDHAKRFGPAWGPPIDFTRAECLVDEDMLRASNNIAVDAVLGRFGLAATWGCLGYGNYKCWKKWRYKCQCRGERVRYGSQRYENNERNPAWGYRAPDRTCSDDLWSCEGPETCNVIHEPKAEEGTC